MTNAKRTPTPWAAAAKIIRKHIKSHGITAKVRARSYSGGCSIDVYLDDEMPATVDAIKEFCGQFKRGYFDGMTDSYEYSNRRDDIPQVDYVFIENKISPKLEKEIVVFLLMTDGISDVDSYEYLNARNNVLTESKNLFWTAKKERVTLDTV